MTKLNANKLNEIFNKNSQGVSEDINGELYTIYNKMEIIKDILKVLETDNVNTNLDEYVDLGLPSGKKWAKCNLGANNPWEYGDYYMWGSITPNTNDKCEWTNTPFNNEKKYFDKEYFNVHKSEWLNGDILKPKFDAAYQATGGKAHIPTRAELEELIANTTHEWIVNYKGSGISGSKFTSKVNGNSIFIPASGYRCGSSFDYIGRIVSVWSSSLYTFSPIDAHYSYLSSSTCCMTYYFRQYGFCVRPVSE